MYTTSGVTPPSTNTANFIRKRPFWLVGLIFLVLAASAFGLLRYFGGNRSTIKIGDTTVTKTDINRYASSVESYSKENNVDFGGTPGERALEDLILNAALKKEAKERGIEFTQEDIDSYLVHAYSAYGSKEQYYAYIEAQGITEVVKIRTENEVLKPKLEQHLIATKEIFLISVPYDTPLAANSDDHGFGLHDESRDILKTKFLPLFQQQKSRQDIASQVDVDFTDDKDNGDSNPEPYRTKLVTNATLVGEYSHAKPYFNDIEVESFKDIPGLISTDEKIKELTEPGQYSEVFASKAGFFAIARLEAKSSGNYNSWEDFIEFYRNKYAARVAFARPIIKIINRYTQTGVSALKQAVAAADNIIFKKAEARHNSAGCSAHNFSYYISSYDAASGGRIGGAQVRYEHVSDCSPNGGGVWHTTVTTGPRRVQDNCWSNAVLTSSWRQTPPAGYNYVRVDSDNNNNNWPTWNPAAVNSNNGGITVNVYYARPNRPPVPRHVSPADGAPFSVGTTSVTLTGEATDPDGNFTKIAIDYDEKTTGASDSTYVNRGWVPMTDSGGGSWSAMLPQGTNHGGPVSVSNCKTYRWRVKAQDNGPGTLDSNPLFTGFRTFSVACPPALPDLIARNLTGPASVTAGTTISFTGDVYNAGASSAGSSTARFCKDNPSCYTTTAGAPWLGERPVGSLGVGSSSGTLTSNSWTTTAADVGAHTITLCADVTRTGAVNESNEDNNCATIPVTVNAVPIPDTPPAITMTPDCSAQTVRIRTTDVNGGTSNVEYSVDSPSFEPFYNRLITSNDFTVPMGGFNQTVPHSVYARTRGIAPGGGPGASYVTSSVTYGPCVIPVAYTLSVSALPPTIDDVEQPTRADFYSDVTVTVSGAPGVRTTVTRDYFIRRVTGVIQTLAPSDPNTGLQTTRRLGPTTRSTPALNAGDQVCQTVGAATGSGTVDSGGNIVVAGPPPAPSTACVTIASRPYLKVYQGSVSAGSGFSAYVSGGFGGNCPPASGQISTYALYNIATDQARGSSAQYGAQAMGSIVGNNGGLGFFSASQRGVNRGYLSFANDSFNGDSNWGGNFGAGRCLINYFEDTQKPDIITRPAGALDISSPLIVSGNQYKMTGNTLITASSTFNKKVTLYIEGNVMIASDINYPTTYSLANVPYLTIVVKGNLYIDSGVYNIAGLYIAQPRTLASGGTINTCGTGGIVPAPVPAASITTVCDGGQPLVVRGAFIARTIHFHRTHGSTRRDSIVNEPNTSTTMAEKFYLAPELYLDSPVFKSIIDSSSNEFGEAQSYTNVPPVF